MNLDGFNYAFGFYSRLNMPYSLELDVLGYYANNIINTIEPLLV